MHILLPCEQSTQTHLVCLTNATCPFLRRSEPRFQITELSENWYKRTYKVNIFCVESTFCICQVVIIVWRLFLFKATLIRPAPIVTRNMTGQWLIVKLQTCLYVFDANDFIHGLNLRITGRYIFLSLSQTICFVSTQILFNTVVVCSCFAHIIQHTLC